MTVNILKATSGFLAVGVAFVAFQNSALAQDEAQAKKNDGGLDEIVVTAQRRAESLVDVPLSIQAVASDTLQRQGVTRLEELQISVPGLTMQYGSNGYLTPFLRGIGNAVAGNYAENSVAIYVDDVPRPRSSSATELVNIERVEVLKGPQGALYGRNATGGAINIVSREPTNEFSGIVRATYGSFNTIEGQAYLNLPFSENIAMNVALSHRERDGLIKNRAAYSTNPLRPSATDPLQLRLDPNFSTPRRGPKGQTNYENRGTNAVDAKLKINFNDAFSVVLRGDYTRADDTATTGWINTELGTLAAVLTGATGIPFAASDLVTGKPGRTAYTDQQNFKDVVDYGGSIKAVADFDGATITSITALRWNRNVGSSEIDATQIPVAGFTADFRSKTLSQELRAVSNGEGPLQWIVGGTYFQDKVNDRVAGEVGTILFPGGATGLTKEQILAGQFPRATLPNLNGRLDVKAWAAFAQVSYEFNEAFEIIASGRYSEENRKALFPAQALTGNIGYADGRKEHAFTPAVTLNYNLPGSGLVYARWAKGFKSGGLNNLLNPTAIVGGGVVGINGFKPEKLTSYEIGYKADLFDRRLRVIAAAYYYDYKNLQVSRTLSPEATSFVLNADKARVKGAELELTGKLGQFVTLSAGGAYTDGKYKNFKVEDQVNFDASGNRMINTPKWQLSSTLDVNVPVNDRYNAFGSATVSYRTGFYFDPENSATLRQEGYAVVNGQLGVETEDKKFSAYFFVKNAFNKAYAIFGQRSGFGTFVSFGDRRVIGGTVEARF